MDNFEEIQLEIEEIKNQVNDLRTLATKNTFSNSEIVTTELSQLSGGYQSANFVHGTTGWRFDALGNLEAGSGYFRGDITGATGTFSGTVTVGSLAIGTTPNWLKVDTVGNMWSGADTLANAKTTKFAVENTGALYATSATISGALTTQVGSTINGTYIDSLVVSKLAAGTITSKAITLAVSAGTGDSYIAAGKTDFTNTDAGFILGIDDSDSDKAKFYIGNSTNYFNYDGTDVRLVGGSINTTDIIQTFEAGENISSGNVVGIGKTTTTYFASSVSDNVQVWSQEPTTNYVGTSTMQLNIKDKGGGDFDYIYSLVKFNINTSTFPKLFSKVYLKVYVNSSSGLAANSAIRVYRNLDDFDEDTVTYNTIPTNSGRIWVEQVIGTGTGEFLIDITDLYCLDSSGVVNNYGLRLQLSGPTPGGGVGTSTGCVLRTTRTDNSDCCLVFTGLTDLDHVWLSDADNGLLDYYAFIGVASETKNTGQTININVGDFLTTTGLIAGEEYRISSSPGGITYGIDATENIYKIGKAISTTKLKKEKNQFENYGNNYKDVVSINYTNDKYIVIPTIIPPFKFYLKGYYWDNSQGMMLSSFGKLKSPGDEESIGWILQDGGVAIEKYVNLQSSIGPSGAGTYYTMDFRNLDTGTDVYGNIVYRGSCYVIINMGGSQFGAANDYLTYQWQAID